MNSIVTQPETIEMIWQDFIDGKIKKNPGIRKEVFESWVRARSLKIDPYLELAPTVLTGLALAEELERKRELLSVAKSVIEDIYSVIKGSSSGVWLSNEKGVIINCVADPDIGKVCEERHFKVGTDWNEDKIGGNAIGTALYLKRPIQFTFAEHYRKVSHICCCSGAPIKDSDGRIIGVLDVTGFWNQNHPHTLGMVVAGVGAIQRELRLRMMHQELSTFHQYIMEMIESVPSGIIIVNQEGIITNINHNACEILKTPAQHFCNKNAFEAFDKFDGLKKILTMNNNIEETEYYSPKGKFKLHFTVTRRPIKNSWGGIDGAVFVLREIDAVRRIAGKMAGYRAKFDFSDIVGEDPLLRIMINRAQIAASTSSNIIILGETGTGKEVLAQAIHNASDRSDGAFVAINCGALPRELIGSELFGYEEGAFTGAKRGGNPGKFELANHGTLFLDEIGDMPFDLQLVLLRVLQEKVVVRLGGQKELPIDVRIVVATNKDIHQMIARGLFREDLYYRLSVVLLKIPALRDRRGDIAILAKYFLETNKAKMVKEIDNIDPETLARLEQYDWPGNIRELENIIERAIIFSKGPVLKIDFQISTDEKRDNPTNLLAKKTLGANVSLKSGEKTIIECTLNECKGNISQAAKSLGITRATMYRKLREYCI